MVVHPASNFLPASWSAAPSWAARPPHPPETLRTPSHMPQKSTRTPTPSQYDSRFARFSASHLRPPAGRLWDRGDGPASPPRSASAARRQEGRQAPAAAARGPPAAPPGPRRAQAAGGRRVLLRLHGGRVDRRGPGCCLYRAGAGPPHGGEAGVLVPGDWVWVLVRSADGKCPSDCPFLLFLGGSPRPGGRTFPTRLGGYLPPCSKHACH